MNVVELFSDPYFTLNDLEVLASGNSDNEEAKAIIENTNKAEEQQREKYVIFNEIRANDQKNINNYGIIPTFYKELAIENGLETFPKVVGSIAHGMGIAGLLGFPPTFPVGVASLPLLANSIEETANTYLGKDDQSGYLRELSKESFGDYYGNMGIEILNVLTSLPAFIRPAKIASTYGLNHKDGTAPGQEARIFDKNKKGEIMTHEWKGLSDLTKGALTVEALLALYNIDSLVKSSRINKNND